MVDFKEKKLKIGDENIPKEYSSYEVIEHKIGNYNDVEENSNKFFSIELWKCNTDWLVYTNYGRVENIEYCGAVGIYGPSDETTMRDFFNKKWKEKSRKYKEISFIKANKGSAKARLKKYGVTEEEIPEEKKKKIVESKTPTILDFKLHDDIKRIVNQLYNESSTAIKNNAAVEITSDGITTPLGILTFKTIDTGRKILGELGEAIKNKDEDEVKKLSSHFYSYIPTKLSRKITKDDYISTDIVVQQKIDLLQMMNDALDIGGNTYVSDINKKYLELGSEFEFLSKTDPEWKRLEEKVIKTRAQNHLHMKVKVKNIYKLIIKNDRVKYDNCKLDNIQEFFHGSRNANLIGILKSGLRIAPKEAPATGYMFDKGIYFADASTKSLNYSLLPFPGVEKSNNCFMFIFDVKLGKIKELENADYNASRYIKDSYNSVKGVKGRSLYNNEYITYTESQQTARYLIELER